MPTRKPTVPRCPRAPLTKKARAAIDTYVGVRVGEAMMLDDVIRRTLDAERMHRVDLYAYLAGRGFRWYPRHGRNGVWAKWKLHACLLDALS